jgi:hypothetical protein
MIFFLQQWSFFNQTTVEFKFSSKFILSIFNHIVIFHFETSSAIFEMGNTKVIAAVYGPREVQYNH